MKQFSKKYDTKILESIIDDIKDKLSNKYKILKEIIIQFIDDSLTEKNLVNTQLFIDNYLKDDTKAILVNLNNNADIYNFYLKYMGNIDEVCNNENFFEKKPSELNIISLYDYIIEGTKFAIREIMLLIKKEI